MQEVQKLQQRRAHENRSWRY